MGSSASAMLVFGIDIGDEDGYGTLGPLTAKYDQLQADWWDPEADNEPDEEASEWPGFAGRLIEALAARTGWPGARLNDESIETFVERMRGVEIVSWGHYDYPRHILAAAGEGFKIDNGSNWEPHHFSVTELAPDYLDTAAGQLMTALDVLGLTTTHAPGWLLVADYG